MADKMGVTELNEILLKIMPNIWSKQAYVQGFDCETISLKKDVNMFDRIEISETIYECVLTPYYYKLVGQNPSVLNSVGIIEEKRPLKILAPRSMGALESAVNNM